MKPVFEVKQLESIIVTHNLPHYPTAEKISVPTSDLGQLLGLSFFRYSESIFLGSTSKNLRRLMITPSTLKQCQLAAPQTTQKIIERCENPLDAFIISDMRKNKAGEICHEKLGWGLFASTKILEGTALFFVSGECLEDLDTTEILSEHIQTISDNGDVISGEKIGGFFRFLQHLPSTKELATYHLSTEIANQLATENVAVRRFSPFGVPSCILIVEAIREIMPGELIGTSYGALFWLLRETQPYLFYKNGEIYPDSNSSNTHFLHLAYQEGLEHYEKEDYLSAILLFETILSACKKVLRKQAVGFEVYWLSAQTGLALANANQRLKKFDSACLHYIDTIFYFDFFSRHCTAEAYSKNNQIARIKLQEILKRVKKLFNQASAEMLLFSLEKPDETHYFSFSFAVLNYLISKKIWPTSSAWHDAAQKIWATTEIILAKLLKDQKPLVLLKIAENYLQAKIYLLSFPILFYLESQTILSLPEHIQSLNCLLLCCHDNGREDLAEYYRKKKKLLCYEQTANEHLLKLELPEAISVFITATNFLKTVSPCFSGKNTKAVYYLAQERYCYHLLSLALAEETQISKKYALLDILIRGHRRIGQKAISQFFETERKLLPYENDAHIYLSERDYLKAAIFFSLARNRLILDLPSDELDQTVEEKRHQKINFYWLQESACYRALANNLRDESQRKKVIASSDAFFSASLLTEEKAFDSNNKSFTQEISPNKS